MIPKMPLVWKLNKLLTVSVGFVPGMPSTLAMNKRVLPYSVSFWRALLECMLWECHSSLFGSRKGKILSYWCDIIFVRNKKSSCLVFRIPLPQLTGHTRFGNWDTLLLHSLAATRETKRYNLYTKKLHCFVMCLSLLNLKPFCLSFFLFMYFFLFRPLALLPFGLCWSSQPLWTFMWFASTTTLFCWIGICSGSMKSIEKGKFWLPWPWHSW